MNTLFTEAGIWDQTYVVKSELQAWLHMEWDDHSQSKQLQKANTQMN